MNQGADQHIYGTLHALRHSKSALAKYPCSVPCEVEAGKLLSALPCLTVWGP